MAIAEPSIVESDERGRGGDVNGTRLPEGDGG